MVRTVQYGTVASLCSRQSFPTFSFVNFIHSNDIGSWNYSVLS